MPEEHPYGTPPPSPYDEYADAWAERIRSGENLYHRYLEKPRMLERLPNLNGMAVLCLGCGSGEECFALSLLGTRRVVGIDVSAGLLDIAKRSYPQLEFTYMDMNSIAFHDEEFDFAYSSLAFHYLIDLRPMFKRLHRILKPMGRVLFSSHHPLWWASDGDYLRSRSMKVRLYDQLDVTVAHKPLSEIFSEIRESGFLLRNFIEPAPLPELQDIDPALYATLKRVPIFMILELEKREDFHPPARVRN